MLLNILAHELASIRKHRIDHEDIFNAVHNVNSRCRGGYAVVAMVPGTFFPSLCVLLAMNYSRCLRVWCVAVCYRLRSRVDVFSCVPWLRALVASIRKLRGRRRGPKCVLAKSLVLLVVSCG